MQHEINVNPLYNFVRDFRKQTDDIPSNMHYMDTKAKSPAMIADQFRIFFESVYRKSSPESLKNYIKNGQHNEKIQFLSNKNTRS